MAKVKLPTIPPHQAAQQLRIGIKLALKKSSPAGKLPDVVIAYKSFTDRVSAIRAAHTTYRASWLNTSEAVEALRQAAKTRRTSEILARLEALQHMIAEERTAARQMWELIRFYDPKRYSGEYAGIVDRNLLENWNQLVQCLPTQPDMPTDAAQMMIRAFVAILRANNVEGIEGITHVTKEVTNGDTQAAGAPASGPEASAVGVVSPF
jgi:hypothetical protein